MTGSWVKESKVIVQALRSIRNKWALMEQKSFCKAKGTINQTKRQPTERGKIFANPISIEAKYPKSVKNSRNEIQPPPPNTHT